MSKALERVAQFQPPWRSRNPDGSLSDEYGPSVATMARRLKRFNDWAWRPGERAHNLDAVELYRYMWTDAGHLRTDVPKSERDAYRLVYAQGYSRGEAAAILGINRDTVKKYLKRLRKRL